MTAIQCLQKEKKQTMIKMNLKNFREKTILKVLLYHPIFQCKYKLTQMEKFLKIKNIFLVSMKIVLFFIKKKYSKYIFFSNFFFFHL